MNRDFRKSASEAPRASIRIAAGVGRRPEPVVTEQRKFHNPVGVEYKILTNRIQSHILQHLFDPYRVDGNGFNKPRVSLRFTRGYYCCDPCGVRWGV